MARKIAWDKVPDSNVIPAGHYLAEIGIMTEEESRSGIAMVKTVFKIYEPGAYAGVFLYHYYIIGTTDDPAGEEEETMRASPGMRDLKKTLKKASCMISDDFDVTLSAAKGHRLVLKVIEDIPKEGPYAGQVQNRVRGFFSSSERVAQLDTEPQEQPTADTAPVEVKSRRSMKKA